MLQISSKNKLKANHNSKRVGLYQQASVANIIKEQIESKSQQSINDRVKLLSVANIIKEQIESKSQLRKRELELPYECCKYHQRTN